MNKFPTYWSIAALMCLSLTSFGQNSYRTLIQKIGPIRSRSLQTSASRATAPLPQGVPSYPLYLTSTQLGTPERIIRETAPQLGDSLDYAYQGVVTYQGGKPSVILIVDSGRHDTLSRQEYAFSATGKILSVKNYFKVGGSLLPYDQEVYTYDRLDSIATYDRYLLDSAGTRTQIEGDRYNRSYDASNRVTVQIDSSLDMMSGRFFAVSKTEYTYQGTATAPRQATFSDTAGGSFQPSLRLARIVWNNPGRFWISSADIQIPLTGTIFLTAGNIAGVLTGQEFATTLSYRTSLTGPLQPQQRTTMGFNAQGDRIRDMSESYDSASASWMVNSDEHYVHTYANPGGKLSRMVHYTYDSRTSGMVPQEAYIYGAASVTPVKRDRIATLLSPNPARSSVTVSGRAAAGGRVLAPTGQEVRNFRTSASGQARVELDGLAPGIYQVQVEGATAGRLVIE